MKKIFTLIAAALMAVNVSAANKVLKITGTADKANPWDIQCFINLKNVEKGKADVVKFDVYTTAGTEFKIGTEAIDETQTEHMTEWNASAVFNYTEELTLTNEKSEAVINFPGKTTVTCHSHCTAKPGMEIDHTNGNTKNCNPEILKDYEYAATALLLNVGKMPKDAVIYIGSNLHVVALLLHFLVEQTDLSAYQLLCRSRGAEGKPCRRKGCSDDMDCFHNRDLLLKMIEYSDG